MKKYIVFYLKPYFTDIGPNFNTDRLNAGYSELLTLEAENLDDVYYKMQGEIWSPNGEARELIASKGLDHTSMDVYDVIYDIENKTYHMVAPVGFYNLGQ